MKSVCAQYIVAITTLIHSGYVPTRTCRLSFVPDEEISGQHGMGILLNSEWFKQRRVAIAFDEGKLTKNSGDLIILTIGYYIVLVYYTLISLYDRSNSINMIMVAV